MTAIVIIFFIYVALCTIVAGTLADQRGRPAWAGFLAGFLFGILGVLVIALLAPVESGRALGDRRAQRRHNSLSVRSRQ